MFLATSDALRRENAESRLQHSSRHRPPPGLAFGEPDDRLQRVIQYSETPVIESISRSVLDTPLSRSMTTICEALRRALDRHRPA